MNRRGFFRTLPIAALVTGLLGISVQASAQTPHYTVVPPNDPAYRIYARLVKEGLAYYITNCYPRDASDYLHTKNLTHFEFAAMTQRVVGKAKEAEQKHALSPETKADIAHLKREFAPELRILGGAEPFKASQSRKRNRNK